ncbi:MAG: Rpn family recombination-promoting nuclease/putative transposase [Clostridia bacterium]|nr:Rpn family recombination-promoting nuclease/putative transposase [Clostridia bacterium]
MTETILEKPEYGPTNDVIFKCLFGNKGNEKIAKSFLEYVTGEKIEQISTDCKLDLQRKSPKSKKMEADLIAKDEKLRKYIIEMQRKAYNYLPERFIGYLSNVYIADIKVAEDYEKLKRTVMVIVMEENLKNLKDLPDYHTTWNCREKNHPEKILTKSTEIHIIELSKYKKQKTINHEIVPWLEFLINPYGEEVINMARTMEELEAAVKQLHLLNSDEEVRRIADAEDWAEYDRQMQLAEIRETGMAEGLAEGTAIGEKKAKLEIAKKLLKNNTDIKTILDLTDLKECDLTELLEAM